MTMNSWSFCLQLPRGRISCLCHHAWFCAVWQIEVMVLSVSICIIKYITRIIRIRILLLLTCLKLHFLGRKVRKVRRGSLLWDCLLEIPDMLHPWSQLHGCLTRLEQDWNKLATRRGEAQNLNLDNKPQATKEHWELEKQRKSPPASYPTPSGQPWNYASK